MRRPSRGWLREVCQVARQLIEVDEQGHGAFVLLAVATRIELQLPFDIVEKCFDLVGSVGGGLSAGLFMAGLFGVGGELEKFTF